jgi:hypothetical protein
MHTIEPYYGWNHIYRAEEDENSPFFEREYSEFYFTNAIYNYVIHPQWDEFGSPTLYLKILFVDYNESYCILEMMGEWNDCIHNDIMTLKREIIDVLIDLGIDKFILLGENVLNFHSSDDSYYEEWFADAEEGWIAMINFRDHVIQEFCSQHIDYYVVFGGELDEMEWRKLSPKNLYKKVSDIVSHRLG